MFNTTSVSWLRIALASGGEVLLPVDKINSIVQVVDKTTVVMDNSDEYSVKPTLDSLMEHICKQD